MKFLLIVCLMISSSVYAETISRNSVGVKGVWVNDANDEVIFVKLEKLLEKQCEDEKVAKYLIINESTPNKAEAFSLVLAAHVNNVPIDVSAEYTCSRPHAYLKYVKIGE